MRHTAALLLTLYFSISELSAQSLEIGLLLAPKQRQIYEDVFAQFTEETSIELTLVPRDDADYKQMLPKWLAADADGPDVLYWQSAQRLFSLVERYQLPTLNHLWDELNLDHAFGHLKPSISVRDDIFAIPFSYYHWGMYYKKPVIERYGGAPRSWQGLLELCQKMRTDGLAPIGLGTEERWPVAAWFDYLNLRLNGMTFHHQLLAGDIDFADSRVRQVFEHWKQLLDQRCFNNNRNRNSWEDIASRLYREQVGITLMGNFIAHKWPKQARAEMGFAPFPSVGEFNDFEVAPTEVFILNPHSEKREQAEQFLAFVARADTQSLLNIQLGYLPPHADAVTSDEPLTQAGQQLLRGAQGVTQYFDRNTQPEFEQRALSILVNFVEHGDIDSTLTLLERARQETLLP